MSSCIICGEALGTGNSVPFGKGSTAVHAGCVETGHGLMEELVKMVKKGDVNVSSGPGGVVFERDVARPPPPPPPKPTEGLPEEALGDVKTWPDKSVRWLMAAVEDYYFSMRSRFENNGVVFYSPDRDRNPVCDVKDRDSIRRFDWQDHVNIYNTSKRCFYDPKDPEFRNLMDMGMAGLEKTMMESRLAAIVPEGSPLGRAMLNLTFRFNYAKGSRMRTVEINMTYWGHEVNSDGIL